MKLCNNYLPNWDVKINKYHQTEFFSTEIYTNFVKIQYTCYRKIKKKLLKKIIFKHFPPKELFNNFLRNEDHSLKENKLFFKTVFP